MADPDLATNTAALGMLNAGSPLADALFGKTKRMVLGLLLGHADETFYIRQLARLLQVGHGALQRELAGLSEAGILVRESVGREVYYRANIACPIYPDLRDLLLKTVGIVDVLRNALSALAPRITAAFVYGSMAKGKTTNDSDVDIMLIGDVTLREVVVALNPSQDTLRREVNPSVYPPHEFHTKLLSGHHFLTSVMGEPKLFVIGDEHDLTKVA